MLIWLVLLGSDLVYGDGQAGPCMAFFLAGPVGQCMVHGLLVMLVMLDNVLFLFIKSCKRVLFEY